VLRYILYAKWAPRLAVGRLVVATSVVREAPRPMGWMSPEKPVKMCRVSTEPAPVDGMNCSWCDAEYLTDLSNKLLEGAIVTDA
jgi:hypothetical protein